MPTEPNKDAGQGPDRQKMLTVLVPAAGVAAIVILVAVILAVSDSDGGGTNKGGPGGPNKWAEGPGKPMSDGSPGGTDDPGLKDIGDGLRVRDLKEGTGPEAKPGATVKVHYTGWLVDGKQFDSSKTRGEPATFSLNEVVKGWGRGIPGMKPGGIRKLVIPAALGYGARGQGDIPPNATLIFEVELLEIK